MCILSVVSDKGKVILTFNRDEHPERPFSDPAFLENKRIFCPLDLVSGGSWIGKNENSILCLQNGADVKHFRDAPYDKSRGLILFEILKNSEMPNRFNPGSLKIEPFTIHEYDFHLGKLSKTIYDGQHTQSRDIDLSHSYIQFSSTLYSPEQSSLIRREFENRKKLTENEIMQFHMDYRIGTVKNSLKRPATSSITQFIFSGNKIQCAFYNLISGKNSFFQLA